MDKQGTDKLFNYFGNECIVYDLERAIKDGALCKYKYYPIPVVLEMDELEEYSELTEKIKKSVIEENGKIKISEDGKLLVFKRSRLLAKARQKIPTLLKLMEKYKDDNSILVYSGASTVEKTNIEEHDKKETVELTKMIDEVTDSIRNSLEMRVHKFTAEETLDERQEIKHYFEKGLYQVITAIKCLDEGVNIPGIKTAFIMSSSRNPKEFIQRRGRLLRRSKNKKYAEIYDFITLPRDLSDVVYGDYESDRTIILGELFRMNEFAKLAENRNKTEVLITEIMNAYGVFFDIDEENKKMEEYYDG
jgi:superfamily II DNA or RNA helicase